LRRNCAGESVARSIVGFGPDSGLSKIMTPLPEVVVVVGWLKPNIFPRILMGFYRAEVGPISLLLWCRRDPPYLSQAGIKA
jgi:hypothetical protein